MYASDREVSIDPTGAGIPGCAVLEHLADGVMVTDADLETPGGPRIVYVNPSLCEMTGYAAEELLGQSPRILQGPETDPALAERLRAELLAGRSFHGQGINYRKDGSSFTMEWTIAEVPDEQGTPRWFVAVQRDATLPARRLLEARRQAHVDALTGLPNRRHVEDALRGGAWLSARARSAIVLDIDHFKQVNDRYGHLVGDAVLQEVGRRLQEAVREDDLIARWGGEEFCVLTLGARQTRVLAERLHAAVRAGPVATSAGPIDVSVSVGWAAASEDRTTAEELLQAADTAMYRAKRDGRDRVCGT
ncbi:diguanylate cyclase [Paraconexibacter antarcticus]|uniref:Diguanylate cyclase n=1 Tax=Paraconexibacter antarcticus TaxID=2949664 RepID=A0ABY5DWY1_9ACTN|nr:diguanylate cyclase [Paraconexibacter antarcticus]UTI65187.1 diguanylate cyclase [Paraconexibacter antarcticus]